jgi:hypothetical protein
MMARSVGRNGTALSGRWKLVGEAREEERGRKTGDRSGRKEIRHGRQE